MAQVALVFEDAQQRAHGGVAGRIGNRLGDVGGRGLPALEDDVHDLAFAPGEVVRGRFRHSE